MSTSSVTLGRQNGARAAESNGQMELVELLARIGIRENVGRLLVELNQEEWMDSRNLQEATSLRQPEVSTAMRELVRRGLVEIQSEKTGNRGRPRHLYQLKDDLAISLQPFIDVAEERLTELDESLKLIASSDAL